MRGKRAKQYRKLMHQYELAFNFREPYQVLVDAAMIQDTTRFKMDLPHLLERTLHGKVKPMITQCSIRHLYTSTTEDRADKSAWIETAKSFERRRCGHQDLEQPLSTEECLMDVVDAKKTGSNKHRYIVASQSAELRAKLRQIAGVPLVYVQRSVMVMEPMASKSEEVRTGQEADKIRSGVKRGKGGGSDLKRKRDDDEKVEEGQGDTMPDAVQPEVKKRKKKGPKGVNPLSAKKPKKKSDDSKGQGPKDGAKPLMPERIERQIRAAKEQVKAEKSGQKANVGKKRKQVDPAPQATAAD